MQVLMCTFESPTSSTFSLLMTSYYSGTPLMSLTLRLLKSYNSKYLETFIYITNELDIHICSLLYMNHFITIDYIKSLVTWLDIVQYVIQLPLDMFIYSSSAPILALTLCEGFMLHVNKFILSDT